MPKKAFLLLSILLFICHLSNAQTKVDWKQIKNTPTTISGYGITDAMSGSMASLTVGDLTATGTSRISDLRVGYTGSLPAASVSLIGQLTGCGNYLYYCTGAKWIKLMDFENSGSQDSAYVNNLTARGDVTSTGGKMTSAVFRFKPSGSVGLQEEGSVYYSSINDSLYVNVGNNTWQKILTDSMAIDYSDILNTPTNASYTLSGLSEKNYNSLDNRPYVGYWDYQSATGTRTITGRLTVGKGLDITGKPDVNVDNNLYFDTNDDTLKYWDADVSQWKVIGPVTNQKFPYIDLNGQMTEPATASYRMYYDTFYNRGKLRLWTGTAWININDGEWTTEIATAPKTIQNNSNIVVKFAQDGKGIDCNAGIYSHTLTASIDTTTPKLITDEIKVNPKSSVPASVSEGKIYYSSTDHKFYGYNGTEWKALAFE